MAILFTSIRQVSKHLFGSYRYRETMQILEGLPKIKSSGFEYWTAYQIEQRLRESDVVQQDNYSGDDILSNITNDKKIYQNN